MFFGVHQHDAVLVEQPLVAFDDDFEIAAVLVLRAHYTMDVFAGIFAALWVAHVCERISERSSLTVAGRAG